MRRRTRSATRPRRSRRPPCSRRPASGWAWAPRPPCPRRRPCTRAATALVSNATIQHQSELERLVTSSWPAQLAASQAGKFATPMHSRDCVCILKRQAHRCLCHKHWNRNLYCTQLLMSAIYHHPGVGRTILMHMAMYMCIWPNTATPGWAAWYALCSAECVGLGINTPMSCRQRAVGHFPRCEKTTEAPETAVNRQHACWTHPSGVLCPQARG